MDLDERRLVSVGDRGKLWNGVPKDLLVVGLHQTQHVSAVLLHLPEGQKHLDIKVRLQGTRQRLPGTSLHGFTSRRVNVRYSPKAIT